MAKYKVGYTVWRIEDRPTTKAEVLEVIDGPLGFSYHISYEEGGDGWWPEDALTDTPPA